MSVTFYWKYPERNELPEMTSASNSDILFQRISDDSFYIGGYSRVYNIFECDCGDLIHHGAEVKRWVYLKDLL